MTLRFPGTATSVIQLLGGLPRQAAFLHRVSAKTIKKNMALLHLWAQKLGCSELFYYLCTRFGPVA